MQHRAYARWLKRERGLYVDELSEEEVAKYYRRFARVSSSLRFALLVYHSEETTLREAAVE